MEFRITTCSFNNDHQYLEIVLICHIQAEADHRQNYLHHLWPALLGSTADNIHYE